MDETQAIKRLKSGDIGGLELLIARYQEKAIRTAFLITSDNASAEDVVQDTFVRIFHQIRHFDETRPFEPYLMQSVVHAAINAAQKSSRTFSLDQESESQRLESLFQRAATTEDQVEYSQLKQEIFAGLNQLPARERAVIIERYYLEMSEKEMAAEHSLAPGTIKWLLNTARKHLRSILRMEGEEK
jgi:RNA polymerase sigma-70 factor (ECF subfamily)